MQQLIDTISLLRPGQKAWFWLSEEPIANSPMLLMTSFAATKPMETLQEQIAEINIPLGTITATGLVFVEHDGRFTLGAPGLTVTMLRNLSSWVGENIAAYPKLGMLKNLSMTVLDYQGVSREEYNEPGLWSAIPDPPKQREIDRTIRLLTKLPPNKTCWFWATDAGLGKQPTLVIRATKKDPTAQEFSQTIRHLNAQCQPKAKVLKGSLFRQQDGTLVFTSDEDIAAAEQVMQTLLATYPQLKAFLGTAKVAQVTDKGVENYIRIDRETASNSQLSLLTSLGVEQRLYFWFAQRLDSGQPLLLLGEDSAAVKERAQKQKTDGKTLRGKLERTSKGWIHFHSTKDAPWFLQSLSQWVKNNSSAESAKLRFARLTCKAASGEFLGRYKNDALWAKE